MPDRTPRLPARPSLAQLRKQAKELLRAFRDGDADATRRVHSVAPSSTPEQIALADAQWVIARENGFESWAKLAHHVKSTRPEGIARYERLAEEVGRAYVDGDANAIRDFNWTNSTSLVWEIDAERMRRHLPTWYASRTRTFDLALADARQLVARQFGFDRWNELVAQLANEARGATVGRSPKQSALYRIDEDDNAMEVHGAMPERDWDSVFAVMKERGLTKLRGAGQISDPALERLSRLAHVTSLDLSFAKQLSAAGLRHVARLPLESLELGGWGTRVDDAALEVLRHLPKLRTVSLVWAQAISDAGAAHLVACEQLTNVNLMGTPTGDGALRALANKPRLGGLDAGTRVTTHGLAALHDFPVFANPLPPGLREKARSADAEPTYLSLYPTAFSDGGLEPLVGLPGLFSCRLFGMGPRIPPVSRRALEPLAAAHSIESLWCDPTDDAMAAIAAMPRLRKLMCQDTCATDDGWVALSRSQSIEIIWGRENSGLRGRGVRALANMPALRRLGVNLGDVADADLAVLPRFAALRDLTTIGLTDAGFAHVGACARLESVTCMYTKDIGDAATRHLSGLRTLRRYYAGDARIGDESCRILAGLPSLEAVELWNCPAVTNAGAAALASSPSLREVTLDGLPQVTRGVVSLFPPGVKVRVVG